MIMSTHILYETNRMGKRAVYLKDGELIFSRTLNDIQQAFPHLETHLALVEALKTQQA
jgi:ABC-type multidrug transport system ATPase subunit